MKPRSKRPLRTARLSIAIALLLTSAGVTFFISRYILAAKQVAQCNRLNEILNEGHAKVLAFQAQDEISTHQLASELEGITLKLGGAELSDPNLRHYRGNFVRVYRELSQDFRKLGQALTLANEADMTQTGQQQVKQAVSNVRQVGISVAQTAENADRLAGDVNSYCAPSAQ
ncbi:hypothetical protein IQ235_09180 [Oscillatoriales cyanobacterium LEGE 11467]|uniref:Uncharacterized protein n=1 Tax=Zarconia navalis LEGE 11467 TaxID=1828826 RepID=A0A928VZ38_9CYAN|nr:hypothetical protein [Zarconia navalis]MBE9040951.1 hypothetical protein [Zarconia navalis LEGE 11467]